MVLAAITISENMQTGLAAVGVLMIVTIVVVVCDILSDGGG